MEDKYMDALGFVDLQQMRDECISLLLSARKQVFSTTAILDLIEARKAKLFESGKLDSIERACFEKENGLKPENSEVDVVV